MWRAHEKGLVNPPENVQKDLYLKLGKCEFTKEEIEFLGWKVNKDRLTMDLKKVQVVMKWQSPTRVKGVRSFLEMANFYHPFIPKFTEVTQPLTELTRKNVV